jgi:hypothetical protein
MPLLARSSRVSKVKFVVPVGILVLVTDFARLTDHNGHNRCTEHTGV